MDTLTPDSPGVTTISFTTPATDGDGEIELRWYTRTSAAPGPAVVYAHGGGMIGGSLDLRIAVMGDSGGGCPTAGAAILARDFNVPLARQILIHPMLDDRNTTPGAIPPGVLTWTYDSNYTGWHCLLGDDIGGDKVSPVAAPGG
jgi:acetyl esterase/lipase